MDTDDVTWHHVWPPRKEREEDNVSKIAPKRPRHRAKKRDLKSQSEQHGGNRGNQHANSSGDDLATSSKA